jgi:hypothetical protein
MKAGTRTVTIAGLTLGLLFGSLPAAEAAHHLVKIRQVFPGSTGNAQAEFVVLQLTSAGENQFDTNVSIRLYDASGTQTNIATSAGDPPNGASQATVLVATQEAESLFTASTDMLLPNADALSPSGGAVCLTSAIFSNLDCVGWGAISFLPGSPPSPIGSAALQIPDDQMLARSIAANCPTLHQSADDTNDSANDFAPAALPATLRENDSPITESPCTPPSGGGGGATTPTTPAAPKKKCKKGQKLKKGKCVKKRKRKKK